MGIKRAKAHHEGDDFDDLFFSEPKSSMGVVISGMIFMFFFFERLIGIKRVKAQNGGGEFLIIIFFKKTLIGIKRAREQNGVYDRCTIFIVFFLRLMRYKTCQSAEWGL